MVQKEKKHLTLNVDAEIANKAVADPTINVSDITEKLLKAFTTSTKTADKEKLYEMYQDLFNLMLPLLQKFKVSTEIGQDIVYESQGSDEYGEEVDPFPSEVFSIILEPNGRFTHELGGTLDNIKQIHINDFFRPQHILDKFLSAVLEGVEYRKNQFKEIEMAKTIIDAITKGTISGQLSKKEPRKIFDKRSRKRR